MTWSSLESIAYKLLNFTLPNGQDSLPYTPLHHLLHPHPSSTNISVAFCTHERTIDPSQFHPHSLYIQLPRIIIIWHIRRWRSFVQFADAVSSPHLSINPSMVTQFPAKIYVLPSDDHNWNRRQDEHPQQHQQHWRDGRDKATYTQQTRHSSRTPASQGLRQYKWAHNISPEMGHPHPYNHNVLPRTPLNGRILSDNVTTPRVHYSSIKVDCGRLSAVGIHHHGWLLLGWNHVVSVLSIVQWRRLVPFEEENKAERLTY